MYSVPPGRAYVADQRPTATVDYFPSSSGVVTGLKEMYMIQYGHRLGLVYQSDVITARR